MKIKKYVGYLIYAFDIVYYLLWELFLFFFTLGIRRGEVLPNFSLPPELEKQHFYLKKQFDNLLYKLNPYTEPSESEQVFLNFLSSNDNYRLALHKEFFKRSWYLKLRYWTFKNYISSQFATDYVTEQNERLFVYTDKYLNSYKEFLNRKEEFFYIIFFELKKEKMPDDDIQKYVTKKIQYSFTDIFKKSAGGIYQAVVDWEREKQKRIKAGTFFNDTGFYTEDDFN